MLIALDHDGTYDRDPDMWQGFMSLASLAGHRVICVSLRGPGSMIDFPGQVIYTRGIAKKDFCEEQNIKVDIWIDVNPHYILQGASR